MHTTRTSPPLGPWSARRTASSTAARTRWHASASSSSRARCCRQHCGTARAAATPPATASAVAFPMRRRSSMPRAA
eukprot:6074242-Lingulodinium_polyedra.AAC.1